MPRRRHQVDLRELPSYGISEAAHYLGISEATLRSWLLGRAYPTSSGMKMSKPLIRPADPRTETLSFYNLVEAHVLLFTRQVHGIRMPAVKNAIEYVREKLHVKRPLIQQVFDTDGKDLFVRRLQENTIINVSMMGQLGIRQILDLYLQRIDWDKDGFAARLFPVRVTAQSDKRIIVIDPHISFGRPVVYGTGVTASILWHRRRTGETVEQLSKDYGLKRLEIEEAISYYKAA